MAFYSDDLYTVSSGTNLYDYWNPFVTKFDSSSFYSWENDNIPLYDLEERTDYLWEKLGWPTSSVPGLVLAVSSTIPTHLDVSTNVFTTIQDAIDALPEIIRFPTLIEVAVPEEIGDLKLDNIKCVGDGALEIINRVHGTLYESGDIASNHTQGRGPFRSTLADGNFYSQAEDTSCLLLSATTSSLFYGSDESMAMLMTKWQTESVLSPYVSTCFGDNAQKLTKSDAVATYSGRDVRLGASVFPDTTTEYEGLLYDGTALESDVGRASTTNTCQVVGVYSGNRLSGIKVSNCDGPIYIRGFLVNAASGIQGTNYGVVNDYGIHVINTEGLTLENCGVSRAGVAGLKIDNSNITIRRRFFAARNYDADNRGVVDDHGILANNSTINFLQDSYADSVKSVIGITAQKYGIKLNNSYIKGGEAVNSAQTGGSVITVSRCDTAYHLSNSTISVLGFLDAYNNNSGYKLVQSTLETDSIIADCHTNEGIKLKDSTFTYNTQLSLPSSYPVVKSGATSPESLYLTKNFFFTNGQQIVSENSLIKPQYAHQMPDKHGEFTLLDAHQRNGDGERPLTGVQLDNSEAEFIGVFSNDSYTNAKYAIGRHFLIQKGSSCTLRGHKNAATIINEYASNNTGCNIYVQGNSTLNIAGPTFISDLDQAILCEDNSTVAFVPHFIAEKGSLDISGYNLDQPENHTSVYVNGVAGCLVANNNSVIEMRDLGSWEACWSGVMASDPVYSGIDSRSFIDDHQYFSGGSFTFMPHAGSPFSREASREYGGGSSKFLITETPPRNFTLYKLDNNVTINYIDRNPSVMSVADWREYSNGGVCVKANNNSTINVNNVNFLPGPAVTDGIFLDPNLQTAGGCNDIRIWSFAGGSTLNCTHVSVSGTYPSLAGHYGPRGIYYDGPSFDCSDAAYTAFNHEPYLSGQRFVPNLPQWRRFNPNLASYPELAGLDAVSGLGYYEDMPLGNLAILDFFGLGCSSCSSLSSVENTLENEYYKSWSRKRFGSENSIGFGTSANYENWGIFRLYMEIDSAAKSLSYSGADPSSYDNRPFQTIAQGYFLSGPCSALSSSMDNFHHGLRAVSPSGTEDGSGVILPGFIPSGYSYYTPDKFCMPSRYNIMLDDSASNTFANAKNASIPILGRPKLVNIYRATEEDGGSASLAASGFGQGFKMNSIFDFNKDV